ncbi:uncharacterized protein [Phyllobates terribilis]|uniref:uncharacterized protein n=1 Tax=Phyllobates terribilis TaxID=111132 RepID=UPI003CCAC48C
MGSRVCPDCKQRTIGVLIFHELFCYDSYVMSPPNPQNLKQSQVDREMIEKIVKPLEQHGFKCLLGSRDITDGDVIAALSNPMTIIPITIIPVFKDSTFSGLRDLLIRPSYLNRIVFICFDSTPIRPKVVSRNSFSINIDDPFLLPKLINSIARKCSQNPLCDRKSKFEMSRMCSDPQSTISSIESDIARNNPFRRSDSYRCSFRTRASATSEAPNSSACLEVARSRGDVSIEFTNDLINPEELFICCYNSNENIRNSAAKRLTNLIQKNIVNFCSDDHLHLQNYEKQTRLLIEKYDSAVYMKLYFWILVATFFRIYKSDDQNLKKYMKILTLPNCKISKKPFDQLCQQVYHSLTFSLLAKMKAWTNRLDHNNVYVKKFENCLSMIDVESLNKERKPKAVIKNITSLPWDIKHIIIISIAEKLFQKSYTSSNVQFFSEICDTIGTKYWGVFLEVLESLTEYTLQSYSEGSLNVCMDLYHTIITWNLQKLRKKKDRLSIVLKHVLRKLVYHPVKVVRHFVSPLMLDNDFSYFDTSQLGNCYIKVNEAVVEMCIREHMRHHCPELMLNDEVPSKSSHTSIYKARTPEGQVLVYVFKQRTLNHILQTNTTDDACERFSEMSRIIQECQVNEYIVAWRNVSSNSFLPFFVVENGEPLLPFLHTKENQLTWSQMTQILIEITKAVHHCHSKKIILCDITPASFIIVFKEDGSFKIKLANFLHARNGECENSICAGVDYTEGNDFLCIHGDSKENIPAYFSSPESLSNKTFSEYSEVWMLAATFYSILLYGRQPFEELAHLNVFAFIKEITSQHTASRPISIPPDLWDIVKKYLDCCVTNRARTETVLQELQGFQNNLGDRGQAIYKVNTVCSYINPEDIQMGYLDDTGIFKLEETEEQLKCYSEDSVKLDGKLTQTVTVCMRHNTKRKILQLEHENVLQVNDIQTDCFKTILVTNAFDGHVCALNEANQDLSVNQLFSYLKQVTLGLQELHRHNIVHCDLRCSHIYINPEKGTLKIGHMGRAVCLDGTTTYPHAVKLMPSDAKKWSAPEVRNKGMYSKASDVFNLAAVFWEAISLHINTLYQNQLIEPFQNCKMHLEKYCQSVKNQGQIEDPVHKLLIGVQTCWNPNPTKRPTLDKIIDVINEIMTHNTQHCSTTGSITDVPVPNNSEEVEELYEDREQEDFYEKVINSPWDSVVNEITRNFGLPESRKLFFKFKEEDNYEDVGISRRRKTRSKRGFIL